jgi:molybdenum cofactor guanylyltransferase
VSKLSGITGLVLAGGRGSRMGGVDKGLQTFHGHHLAQVALQRLQTQEGGPLSSVMINANRNIAEYAAFGVPVFSDSLADYAGPLAGFLVGLAQCSSRYLLTVPCDSPLFPLDLAVRLLTTLETNQASIALAHAPENGVLRSQPVFALIDSRLQPSLIQFIEAGGRKIDTWTNEHQAIAVPFDLPHDNPRAFLNANTLEQLRALENS